MKRMSRSGNRHGTRQCARAAHQDTSPTRMGDRHAEEQVKQAHRAATGLAQPTTKGVRLHDLRHTAATLWLIAGVHFMQVSKWLGHSSYVLTLTTYGDYRPGEEAENPLPEPVATAAKANVVPLHRTS
jgi:integrase